MIHSFDDTKLTRVCIVNDSEGGIVHSRYAVNVQVSVQDGGRTLKVFLQNKPEPEPVPNGDQ